MPERRVRSSDGHIWLSVGTTKNYRGVEIPYDFLARYERVMREYESLQRDLVEYDNKQHAIDHPGGHQ